MKETMKQKLVVLSGSGISAESGLSTFRDAGGLWEGYDVMVVASPDGWRENPKLVLNFYNERRRAAKHAKPNLAHTLLAKLEAYYNIVVVTQNVDNLHEQGGSSKVIHLHGELIKSRSTARSSLVYDIEGTELNWGDTCELGAQLRPHIVWFGEMVPLLETAADYVRKADILIIIGTSLLVYPAASLIHYAPRHCYKYIIDPKMPNIANDDNLFKIEKPATSGMQDLYDLLEKG